jgi:putative transposase
MPRTARIDAPGLLHHVRARGIERRKIFLDDGDRLDFLNRLEVVCADGAATVYGWCLLSNHFHLSIRAEKQSLSTTMRRLLSGYVTAFNQRHRRNGHLFQNRYKSTVIDDERYFLALLRYIHLNPVRAKLVEDVRSLKDYAWTGHRVLMGKARMSFQDTEAVLGRFGERAGEARRELVKFMGEEGEREERKLFKGGGLVRSAGGYEALKKMSRDEKWAFDERILGSGSFVESVLKQAESEMLTPSMTESDRAIRFEQLITRVAAMADIDASLMTSSGRDRHLVRYRQILCFIAVKHLGMSLTAVGHSLNISKVAVLKSVKKGLEIVQQDSIDVKKLFK